MLRQIMEITFETEAIVLDKPQKFLIRETKFFAIYLSALNSLAKRNVAEHDGRAAKHVKYLVQVLKDSYFNYFAMSTVTG